MATFYNVTSTGGDARALQVPSAATRSVSTTVTNGVPAANYGVPETNCEYTSKRQLLAFLNANLYDGLEGHELSTIIARLNSTDTSGWADPTYFIPSGQVVGSGATGNGGTPLAGSTIAKGDS
jgi:hypothetical protein